MKDSFADRLIKSLDKSGVSAYALSKKLLLQQSTISNYKKGKSEPNASTIKEIASILEVNYDWLQSGIGNIEVNSNVENIEVKYISQDDVNIMMVPLVNQYAYGGYMNGCGDPEFIDNLPKIPVILDKEYKGQYMFFEVKGDSMECDDSESINEGDRLLCRDVRPEHWQNKLHINKWDFVICHKDRGIVVKRIIKHDVEKGILTLHSLNDFYQDYEVNLADVQKIFNIVDIQKKRKRR